MTQEELDALMGGEIDLEGAEEEEVVEEVAQENDEEDDGDFDLNDTQESRTWGPPATHENKVVHQLDDVTKESEEKASEIFDIIEGISGDLMDKEENLNGIVEIFESNIALFRTLTQKFPDVLTFTQQLEKNEEGLAQTQEVIEALQNSGDSIMNVMDIMQYQDIHRQKIERVINVMRALSRYMNSLFESQVEDTSRVSSAKHIEGDSTANVASTEDIEALLEQFGQG